MKDMTFGEILERFKEKNPHLVDEVIDFRPVDAWVIKIWFRHGISMIVFYDNTLDSFSIINVRRC